MNQQQPTPFQDVRFGLSLVAWIVNGYATAILPFMRNNFGTEFFGINALGAMLAIFVLGAVENSDDMLAFFMVWVLVVVAQRLDSTRAYKIGHVVHSQYVGDSWLACKFAPKATRKTVQMLVEPAICLGAGILFCPYSPGIGRFLILGAFAVLLFNGLQRSFMTQRVRGMQDAYIEQQVTAQMFRRRNEDL